MVDVVTIETPGLGDRSYLAHDGVVAVVVDPQRDIDRVLEVAESLKVRITHVFETHIHNDYVTGGFALAGAVGASYVVSAGEPVEFDRVPASDGERFETGGIVVTAIGTPGHTPEHLSYAIGEAGGRQQALFSGGSMLFGAVGRTDLIAAERTAELTRAQYHSVRHLATTLPGEVEVYPTHGFGSFCSATETTGTASTIERERTVNIALTTDDEDAFVSTLIAGLGAYPRYYAHMAPANLRGPQAVDLVAPDVEDPAELRDRIDAGEWVVDLRERKVFARRHVTGTISLQLSDPFATYLAWTIPWETPLTLIGDSAEQVSDAQRQLVRVGIDRLAGAATGGVDELALGSTSSYAVTDFSGLAEAWGRDGQVVLDVRRPDEWEAGHLAGATHVPFWELEQRLGEVPDGEVWVHCASGFRAAIGASLLARSGRQVVHVDDDWARAAQLGLPMAE